MEIVPPRIRRDACLFITCLPDFADLIESCPAAPQQGLCAPREYSNSARLKLK
jgi:hypothetical protein